MIHCFLCRTSVWSLKVRTFSGASYSGFWTIVFESTFVVFLIYFLCHGISSNLSKLEDSTRIFFFLIYVHFYLDMFKFVKNLNLILKLNSLYYYFITIVFNKQQISILDFINYPNHIWIDWLIAYKKYIC